MITRASVLHIEKNGSIINVGVQEIELQHFSKNLDKNIEHNVKIL
jgi:hypothetical protein